MSLQPWRARTLAVDSDPGVDALQTDVMRFMAILAFCLLAIFALVQSIPFAPPEPVVEVPVPIPEPQASELALAEPVVEVPVPIPEPQASGLALAEPVAELIPESRVSVPRPEPPAPTQGREQRGVSLRFASDETLLTLVRKGEVALFAVAGGRAWRMAAAPGRPSFSSSAPPERFHEMARATVPEDLVHALRRVGSVPASTLSWGVVLSGSTTDRIRSLISGRSDGELLIDAAGGVRLGSDAGGGQ